MFPAPAPALMAIGKRPFRWGARTYVMGIVNVSPESFSGDGIADADQAVAQALRLVEEGADILDVGGQSTRPAPHAAELSAEEEIRRVVPVIERLATAIDVPISVDTYKAPVARAAVRAGASLLNDVWGLRRDPEIARVAAQSGLPLVLMHNQESSVYRDVMAEIIEGLRWSLGTAMAAGVPEDRIIVDPGFGFTKPPSVNLEILRRLEELRALGRPVLLGTSRKGTIGKVLGLPPGQRLEGTAATVVLGIAHGADIVRVHDVRAMVRVARMTDAVVRGTPAHVLAP